MANSVETFVGREEDLKEIHRILENGTGQRGVAICGHSGIGKSELASKYCSEYRQSYDFIAWLNAENKFSLETDFILLGKYLQVSTVDESNKLLEMGILVQKILHSLLEKKTLFVFDNVTNEDSISPYLTHPTSETSPLFLITSQYRGWATFNKCEIDILPEEMAFKFLQESILEKSLNTDLIKYIAKKVNYLPLALQIVASYINNQKLTAEEIREVLQKDFHKVEKTFSPWYGRTMNIAFTIAFNKILEHKEAFQLQLLRLLSIMDGKKIETKLLYHIEKDGIVDVDAIDAAVKLIEGYSLVRKRVHVSHGEVDYYTMHDLMQHAVINSFCDSESISTLAFSVTSLLRAIKHYNRASADKYHVSFAAQWLHHVIPLIETYVTENPAVMKELQSCKVQLVEALTKLGRFQEVQHLLDLYLEYEQKYDPVSVLLTKRLIGVCKQAEGCYQEAIDIYNNVIEALKGVSDESYSFPLSYVDSNGENISGDVHAFSLNIKRDIGWCTIKLGMYEEALQYNNDLYEDHKEQYE